MRVNITMNSIISYLMIVIGYESEYNHEFNYFLSDDSNWLENLTDTFLISAHRDTIISFEININEHPISIVNLEYNYLPYKQESTTWTIYQQCGANGYVLNECGVCGGIGGSGIPEGECDCDENIVDCAGECGGDAMEDECGVCDGDNSTCTGCMNDTACDYDIDATIEDGCEYAEENYNCEGNCIATGENLDENGLDCSQVCGGGDVSCLAIKELIIPQKYSISNIYPNPFNPVTKITYGLPENTEIQITVYDMGGTHITSLVNTFQTAGYHTINWNASSYPSGVYLIRMDSGDFTQTQKVVLVK